MTSLTSETVSKRPSRTGEHLLRRSPVRTRQSAPTPSWLDPLQETEKVVRREICKTTGLLPSRFSPTTTSEWFLAGAEPQEDSRDYFAADGSVLLPSEYSRWCASRDNTINAHVRAEARITNPPPNAHYELDPVLPRSQQMIELTSGLAGDVQWFMNGAPVSSANNGRVFWQLAPGAWNIRAVSRIGIAEETITVKQ